MKKYSYPDHTPPHAVGIGFNKGAREVFGMWAETGFFWAEYDDRPTTGVNYWFFLHDHDERNYELMLSKLKTFSIQPIFKWFDFWVGLFWDSKKRWLYVFYFPMCGIIFKFKK